MGGGGQKVAAGDLSWPSTPGADVFSRCMSDLKGGKKKLTVSLSLFPSPPLQKKNENPHNFDNS